MLVFEICERTDIKTDRQTNRQTNIHPHCSQYFAHISGVK